MEEETEKVEVEALYSELSLAHAHVRRIHSQHYLLIKFLSCVRLMVLIFAREIDTNLPIMIIVGNFRKAHDLCSYYV